MSNSSNQSGVLILVAILMGATISALMFFWSEVEPKSEAASYGYTLQPNKTRTIQSNYAVNESSSEISSATLPTFKSSSSNVSSTGTGGIEFPTSGAIPQVDVQAAPVARRNTASRAIGNTSFISNQSSSANTFSNQYIINPQSAARTDINASIMLNQARAAEASTIQGSKRVAKASATASSSTDASGKNNSKKAPGDPGDPGAGASLPIGDGMWLMLLFAGVYVASMKSKQLQLKGKVIN